MIIQTKAGIPSEKSLNSIFLIGSSIIKPTIMSTGAVAAAGIDKNNGEKNNAIAKQHATTKAVRPERPPCATPDALSTYVVVVEVPKHAPMVVAIASAINASFKQSILPFSSIKFAFVQTPIKAYCIEHVNEQKSKHYNNHIKRKDILPIKLTENRSYRLRIR